MMAAQPGLLSLSSELLRDILDHIEADPDKSVNLDRRAYLSQESFRLPGPAAPDQFQDVASFRLVCRRFSQLGAIHQFSRISTRFSSHGLARLEKIAAQPHLAQHVKKFSYMVPYFYELHQSNSNSGGTGMATLHPGPGNIDTNKVVRKAAEQRQIVTSGEDTRVLRRALTAFTSLQHVQILRVQDRDDALLLTWLRQHQNEAPFLELKWAPACSHSTKTLGAALLDTQSPCSRFSSPMLSPQSAESLAANTPSSFQILVQRLTSLELHFDDSNDLDATMSELSGLFQRIFSSAENMQALHIGFPSHRPLNLPLEQIFHSVKWRYLAAFGIQAWKLDASEIIGLVQRHSDRLRGLRLRDVLLKDGSRWKDVLGFLRQEVPQLEWVSLRRIGYARTFDEQWAVRGAEILDDAPNGAPSDSDDEDMLDDEAISNGSDHSEDDSDANPSLDSASDSDNHDNGDEYSDDLGDSGDERDEMTNTMSFPLRTVDLPTRDSPDTAPCCSSCDEATGTQEAADVESLNDNAVFVSNAQRKAWERWVVPQRCSRTHGRQRLLR